VIKIGQGFDYGFVGFAVVSAGVSPDSDNSGRDLCDFVLARARFDGNNDLH